MPAVLPARRRAGPPLRTEAALLFLGAVLAVCLWTSTLTEAWAWGREDEELLDRSASPWDSPTRRPSHADKRRAWRRALLGEEIRAILRLGVTERGIQAAADRLLSLVA